MNLDVPTLMAATVVGYLMLTLELGLSQRGVRGRPELRRWSWGSWAILLGFVAFGARPVVPLSLSIVFGNGLICLGLALYHQAMHMLLMPGPPPRWLLLAVLPIVVLMALAVDIPAEQRALGASAAYLLLILPTLFMLLRHGWQAERALRLVAVTVSMTALALVFRMVHAVQAPAEYQSLMQPSLGQGLTFLVAFMALLGTGFGFVLAVFERVASQMEKMASHDGLTGCLNRSTTDALLEHALARAQRDALPLAFALLDLDHFKQVNDRHGHRAGDEALRRFAQVARQRLRGADVLGRTGGEEFGLVLPGTDAAGARRLVEEVRLAVAALELHDAQGQPFRVTVSGGVALALPGDAVNADRLYGRADQALYEAKRSGRNQVVLYGETQSPQGSLLPG